MIDDRESSVSDYQKHGFIAGPRGLFHPADLALYDRILEGRAKTLAAGAETKVGMYATNTAGTA